jgi:hypothetical protein
MQSLHDMRTPDEVCGDEQRTKPRCQTWARGVEIREPDMICLRGGASRQDGCCAWCSDRRFFRQQRGQQNVKIWA